MNTVYTALAPDALGPYSQGMETGGFIFTSMQLPIDPQQPEKLYEDIEEEAGRLIDNVFEIVRAGGGDPSSIVKVTLYMTDLSHFAAVNDVYAGRFGDHKPARSVVNVPAIPKGYRLAMEAVAVKHG